MTWQSLGGAARRRRPPASFEGGFTLLELVVVMTIVGVLLAIALPGFTAARASAQEHAAQANIRTALVAANSVFISTSDQSFDSVTPAILTAAEPSLRWASGEQTNGPGTIAALNGQIVETGDWALGLAVDAGDGTCWYAFQADNDAPWYGAAARTGTTCDARDAGSIASGRNL